MINPAPAPGTGDRRLQPHPWDNDEYRVAILQAATKFWRALHLYGVGHNYTKTSLETLRYLTTDAVRRQVWRATYTPRLARAASAHAFDGGDR